MEQPTSAQVAEWYPRLFRVALRLTGNAEDAADLTQQAFCQALGNWGRFDGGVRPTTWLHTILVNCVRDWARRRAVRAAEPLDEWAIAASADGVCRGAGPASREDDPSAAAERAEQLARLRRAIDRLPSQIRPSFALTVLDGYSYKEASEILSLPVGTVASRVHAARQALRAALEATHPEV